ncbi:MAG: helix-turn-helix transcriptional regulator [Clostridiales bacterium]|nr:helix-turn-helix transcriptional regulator [Clostridiales bacterium]
MSDKTGDLMNRLTSTESAEDLDHYLEEIRDKYPKDFSSYIKAVLSDKGMSIADMQKKSGIDRTYIYQIIDGSKHPGRDKIIAIAIACNMNLTECQRALEIAQEGILYAKSRRDSLIIYAINKKMSLMELNGLLEQYSLASLA